MAEGRAETTHVAEGALVDQEYWDEYWRHVGLPVEITRSPNLSTSATAILDVFEEHLPKQPGLRALEIGGAPGQYLAWAAKTFGYQCNALDYSPVGCEKARQNFAALGIPLTVHQEDLFSDRLASIGKFDVVYSLGLLEHFDDFRAAIERHAAVAQSGGWVIVGCPQLRGLNRVLLRLTRPGILATYNAEAMDVRRWRLAAERAGLTQVFAGYVGGFDPLIFAAPERDTRFTRLVRKSMLSIDRFMRKRQTLRRPNSRWTSGYAIAVYKKAESSS